MHAEVEWIPVSLSFSHEAIAHCGDSLPEAREKFFAALAAGHPVDEPFQAGDVLFTPEQGNLYRVDYRPVGSRVMIISSEISVPSPTR
jgi:hypothetical protein